MLLRRPSSPVRQAASAALACLALLAAGCTSPDDTGPSGPPQSHSAPVNSASSGPEEVDPVAVTGNPAARAWPGGLVTTPNAGITTNQTPTCLPLTAPLPVVEYRPRLLTGPSELIITNVVVRTDATVEKVVLFEITGPTSVGGTDNSLADMLQRWRRTGEPIVLHSRQMRGATLAPNRQYMPAVVLDATPGTTLRELTFTYTTADAGPATATATATVPINATYRRTC